MVRITPDGDWKLRDKLIDREAARGFGSSIRCNRCGREATVYFNPNLFAVDFLLCDACAFEFATNLFGSVMPSLTNIGRVTEFDLYAKEHDLAHYPEYSVEEESPEKSIRYRTKTEIKAEEQEEEMEETA